MSHSENLKEITPHQFDFKTEKMKVASRFFMSNELLLQAWTKKRFWHHNCQRKIHLAASERL